MIQRLCWFALCWPVLLAGQAPTLRGFGADPEVSIRIWVPSGSVRLVTWDRDSVMVAGSVAKGSRFFGGGGRQGAKVGIEGVDPGSATLPQGDLLITVPRRAHVWIKMTEGTVTATGTAGELEVISVAGSVAIRQAEGVVSVETIDARIALQGVRAAMRVRAGSGHVTLTDVRGTLTAATVNGDVNVQSDTLDDARIETIGGGITMTGAVHRDALVELETHSGPITLVLDPRATPSLALASRNGSVRNAFGRGDSRAGRILAHSFRGAINVLATPEAGRREGPLIP